MLARGAVHWFANEAALARMGDVGSVGAVAAAAGAGVPPPPPPPQAMSRTTRGATANNFNGIESKCW